MYVVDPNKVLLSIIFLLALLLLFFVLSVKMIEVAALSKHYGDFPALQDANFRISKQHGITALLGPNGAGKTTSLRLITGYLRPTAGSVRINGKEINSLHSLEIKSMIGYLPETTPLYGEMLVEEYIHFMGQARSLHGKQLKQSTDEMVEKFELASHFYTPLILLSKGFRQRVALAASLLHKPEYIILDEPTSGLDPNQIQQIRHIIKELGKEQTLILSTHILQEVEEICNRVIILNRGRVVADENTAVLRSAGSCRLVVKGQQVQESLSSLELVKNCQASSASPRHDGYESYVCELKEDSPEKLFAHAKAQGWSLRELSPLSRSLQEVFQKLTT